jgi:hypothetical protein
MEVTVTVKPLFLQKTERILGAFIFYDKMIAFLNFNAAQELKWFY